MSTLKFIGLFVCLVAVASVVAGQAPPFSVQIQALTGQALSNAAQMSGVGIPGANRAVLASQQAANFNPALQTSAFGSWINRVIWGGFSGVGNTVQNGQNSLLSAQRMVQGLQGRK